MLKGRKPISKINFVQRQSRMQSALTAVAVRGNDLSYEFYYKLVMCAGFTGAVGAECLTIYDSA
jgi:hypothetical protein